MIFIAQLLMQVEQMLKKEMINNLEQHFAEDDVISKFQFQV